MLVSAFCKRKKYTLCKNKQRGKEIKIEEENNRFYAGYCNVGVSVSYSCFCG